MIKVKCPKCQAVVSGPERLSGKKVQCGKCQTVFTFPQAPVAPAAQTPAAQPAARPAAPQPAARPAAPQPAPQPSQAAAPKPADKAPARKVRKSGKSKAVKKYVMLSVILLMLVGLVGAGVFIVPKILAGSSPDIVRMYASPNTFAVGRIDIESIVDSDLYAKLGLDAIVKQAMTEIPVKLKLEDLSTITVMMDKPATEFAEEPPPPMIVVNLKEDTPLKDILDPKMAASIKKIGDVEYIALGDKGVLAKTAEATICVKLEGGESALRKLVGELKSGQKAQLNADLTAAMDRVSGQNSYIAAYVPKSMKGKLPAQMAMLASAKSLGLGFTVDSDVAVKIAADLGTEKEASDASMGMVMMQGLAAGAMQGQASASKDPDVKAVMTVVAKALSGIKLDNEGSVLLAEANLPGGDLVLIKNKGPKAFAAMMAGSGSPDGQPTTAPAGGGNPLEAIMGIFGGK